VVASSVAVGDRFFVGSTDGDVYLLDAAGSVLQRSTAAEGGVQSSAAVDGELVIFGSSRGLHAVALRP
jgi:outer membrane protein assembly factor BamB